MRLISHFFKSIVVLLMLCPCTTAYAVEKDVCLSPGLVKSMLSRFDITAIDDTGKETKKYTAADKCDKDAFKNHIGSNGTIACFYSKINNAPDGKGIDFFTYINEKVRKNNSHA